MPQRASADRSCGFSPWIARLWTGLALAVLAVSLAACAAPRVTNQPAPGQAPGPFTQGPPIPAPSGKVQVGLLLPLSGDSSGSGQAWLQAAELALFEAPENNLALIVRDSGGNPAMAAQAAREVIQKGAQLILGPGFGTEVRAVASVARAAGINVISFSTDKSVAGAGVFVMGILPELQIERIVGYAGRQGLRQFALLAPQNRYGQLVAATLRDAAARAGATVARSEFYDPAVLDSSAAVGQIGQYVSDGGRIDALLVPEGGARLHDIAQRLGGFGIDAMQVRLLGSTIWAYPPVTGDPSLVGAWFPAPDPDPWQAFQGRYRAAFGTDPPRFATIAYDATLLAVLLAGGPNGPDFSTATLTDPAGFSGVDGIFRFRPDGSIDRGLAVMEVGETRVDIREPAPLSFDQVIY